MAPKTTALLRREKVDPYMYGHLHTQFARTISKTKATAKRQCQPWLSRQLPNTKVRRHISSVIIRVGRPSGYISSPASSLSSLMSSSGRGILRNRSRNSRSCASSWTSPCTPTKFTICRAQHGTHRSGSIDAVVCMFVDSVRVRTSKTGTKQRGWCHDQQNSIIKAQGRFARGSATWSDTLDTNGT